MQKSQGILGDSIVHVAVAVIIHHHQVLIARRPSHLHQGGLWEFPGGKVEQGETVKQSLCREIQEELGIDIIHCEPMIKVLYHYEDKSVLLDTWRVNQFKGRDYISDSRSTGMEQQIVQWVDIDKLKQYRFPAANKPILTAVQLPDEYLITPDAAYTQTFLAELQKTLNAAAQSGTSRPPLIQLRIKSLPARVLPALVIECCEIAHEVNARLILNAGMMNHAELTSTTRLKLLKLADGLHLPASQLSDHVTIEQYRQNFTDKLLAASCHNRYEIELANRYQMDFIVLSPVCQTRSHADALPLGWERFSELVEEVQLPAYALGGLGRQDINKAKRCGAQGVAAISSYWVK